MIIGTAFSGIGAPEQALLQSEINHEVVLACENDPYVQDTYIYNYGNPRHFYSDINLIKKLPDLDLFMFGSPCQAFSMAGHRLGMDDYRAVLALKTLMLIQANPPETVVFENVKGILSIDNGETLKHILNQFRHMGYKVHYKVLNALDFGLPQRRERLFVVATMKDGFQFPAPMGEHPPLKKFLSRRPRDPKVYVTESFLSKPKVQHRLKTYSNDYINCITHTIFRKGSSQEYIGYVSAVNHAIGEARIPTVKETIGLFGFSPEFTFPDHISTGKRYNMLANSMAVPVIKALVGQISQI